MNYQFDAAYRIARDNEQEIRDAANANHNRGAQHSSLQLKLANLLRHLADRIDREQAPVVAAHVARRGPLVLPIRYDPCLDRFVYEASSK